MAGWRRLGLLVRPGGDLSWMRTHAAVPFAEPLPDGHVRLYFSGRDDQNRSHPGEITVRLGASPGPVGPPRGPLLPLGAPGCFDDAGVMPSWVVDDGPVRYLYYTGWSLGVSVPFHTAIGLAVSHDGGRTFRRHSTGPILDRSPDDPGFVGSPCVLVEGRRWRMWYVSGLGWERVEGRWRYRGHLKTAESADGVVWRRPGVPCLDFASPDEHIIARPVVLRDGSCYRMWFSSRGQRYRIEYADSPDGLRWTRRGEDGGLEPSVEGWDAEMTCYGFVLDHEGHRYLFYNGGAFGREGIGLAVREGPLP